MHWASRDRLVLVSHDTDYISLGAIVSRLFGTAVTTYGPQIEVLDVAAMEIIASVKLPPKTAYHIRSSTANPAWWGRGGVRGRARFDAPRASREIEFVRRVVHAPGTVIAVKSTSRGVILVRSLGPARGAVIEVCAYGRRSLGPGLPVAVPHVEEDDESDVLVEH
ncbi:hypothetical protein AMAG_18670 [Allomyces macrogynus ATCC 38327]|uniref:Uncharacterized protein n=1 Tax=Allomyces macrogynus (strain ATCC 38327) TaxID=578462 RepID=A0A0L0SH32_ALLM3|nr:hypothetical protein AMAG_18670 [Allomyces macrogynus ATCC 38327]|eukprot:KNE61680.1 hypothetical protein AMAG_18670 [Allomyces macrogynus ATCC 38327]